MAKDPAAQRRLATALRENLKRRKAQARGRALTPGTDSAADSDEPPTPEAGRVGLSPQSGREGKES